MKILFTKDLDQDLVSSKLEPHISADYIEVIKIKHYDVKPFNLKNYSLIFTSANGVSSFFKNQFQPKENFAHKDYNRIYCVGEKTKKELRKNGFGTFKVLKNAETLSQFIIDNCSEEQFIHFCGNLAINVLDEELPLQNIKYKKVIVYETQELNPIIYEKYHGIVFFSPSGVRSFAKNNSLDQNLIFSIGNTTSEELKKATDQLIITSHKNTLADVLHLINENL